jgi:hypothetical protein
MKDKLTKIIWNRLNDIICSRNGLSQAQLHFLKYDKAKKIFTKEDIDYMGNLGIFIIATDIGVGDTLTTYFFDDEMNKLMTVEAGH